jgi:hypothetical protein
MSRTPETLAKLEALGGVGSRLAGHQARLRALVRPAYDLIRAEAGAHAGRSRIGGSPDRPPGRPWPAHRLGPYRFLLQLDFGEVGAAATDLPTSGLLCLFVAEDLDGEHSWADEGYLHAEFHDPSTVDLRPQAPPESVRHGGAVSITFRPTLDLPFDEYQRGGWVLDRDEVQAYDALRDSLHGAPDHLLGYPSHCSLAYDPTPGPEWLPLLTLSSDEGLEWFWHDGDRLMVFIERARLAVLDFSSLRADAG